MDIFKCELCFGHFADLGRWPRVLGCGHSICSACTILLLKEGNINCPSCNSPHPASGPHTIPFNHTVLKILNSSFARSFSRYANSVILSQQDVSGTESLALDQASGALQPANQTSKKPTVAAEPSHHAGICDEHGQYLMFWCTQCVEWICRDCTVVNHPKNVCPIVSIRQAFRDMQHREDNLIKDTVALFDENLKLFRIKNQAVKAVRELHTQQIKELLYIISVHRKAERVLEKENSALQDAMSEGLRLCFSLLESQGNLLGASTLLEMQESRRKAQECHSAILCWFNPRLLEDSTDFFVSKEFLRATATALTSLKQALAMSTRSLTSGEVKPSAPPVTEGSMVSSDTTVQEFAQGIEKEVSKLEELLCDDTGVNPMAGWPVLSPSTVHRQEQVLNLGQDGGRTKDEAINENQAQQGTQKHDKCQDLIQGQSQHSNPVINQGTIQEAQEFVQVLSTDKDVAQIELDDALQILMDREEVYAESKKILYLANTGQLKSPTLNDNVSEEEQIICAEKLKDSNNEMRHAGANEGDTNSQYDVCDVATASEKRSDADNPPTSAKISSFEEVGSQFSEPVTLEAQEDTQDDALSLTSAEMPTKTPETSKSPEDLNTETHELQPQSDSSIPSIKILAETYENIVQKAPLIKDDSTEPTEEKRDEDSAVVSDMKTDENSDETTKKKSDGASDKATERKNDGDSDGPSREALASVSTEPQDETGPEDPSLIDAAEVDDENHNEDINKTKMNERCKTQ